FTCALGTVASGSNATVTVSYTVPAGKIGRASCRERVYSRAADAETGNKTASDTDTVTTSANLSITKTDGETAVTAGDGATHTYTITVSNAGPSNAAGVSISDFCPAGLG